MPDEAGPTAADGRLSRTPVVGSVYRMRRQHPCGGWEWRVLRVGADIGMECLTCARNVMVERARFESRVKSLVVPPL